MIPIPALSRTATAGDRVAEAVAATLLVAALLFGGGPRGMGDFVVQLLAAPALLLGVARWQRGTANRWQKLFLGLCAAAIALGLLQLLPLPATWFANLPQRAAILAELRSAGVDAGWQAMTLDAWGSVRSIAAFAVFVAMWLLASTLPWAARLRLLQLCLLIAMMEALLGFAQAAAGTHAPIRFYDYHHATGAIGTFANRNHYAILMAMLAPLAMAFGVAASRRAGEAAVPGRGVHRAVSAGWYAIALLLVLASALSYSRAGFALTLLAGGVALVALLVTSGLRPRRGWLLPVAFIAIAVLAVGVYAWDGLAQRLTQDPLEDLRWQYLHYGLGVARDYLPWGSGFGSFRWVYASAEPVSAMTYVYADRAHNDVLQVAVEAGVPGLLLLGAFVALLVTVCLRTFPMGRAPALADHAFTSVICVAIWAPLAHSLVDYPLRTHAVALVLALMLACLLDSNRDADRCAGPP
jgi:O-antigen ligase